MVVCLQGITAPLLTVTVQPRMAASVSSSSTRIRLAASKSPLSATMLHLDQWKMMLYLCNRRSMFESRGPPQPRMSTSKQE